MSDKTKGLMGLREKQRTKKKKFTAIILELEPQVISRQ